MERKYRYIISGGGTGGHIFPAISIADELRRREPECEILFVGASGRMEMEKVPAAGYRITGIPVSGLNRNLLSADNLKLPFRILSSLRKASAILKEFRPHAVIGVGGYASAPTLWTAGRYGIPTVIQEQNSFAGLTNRIAGKKASAVCVAYEGMERFFPEDRIVLTGNPIRNSIRRHTSEEKAAAVAGLGLDPAKKTIFILGGSLGAGTLNRCVMKWAEESYDDSVNVIWQCGRYYMERCTEFMERYPRSTVRLYDFIKDMDTMYAAADLIVSRAGAGTISELAAAGKATVFVPSPNVTEDHQTHNAMAMVEKGAAIMVKDQEAPDILMAKATALVADVAATASMEEKMYACALPDAASRIVDQIIRYRKTED